MGRTPQTAAMTGSYAMSGTASGRRSGDRHGGAHSTRAFAGERLDMKEPPMKNPLDSITGTIISGFVLTAILYAVVRGLVS